MPALPPKPLPRPLARPMPRPLPRPLAEPTPKPLAAPAFKPTPGPVVESAQETMQASFLIGPPEAPEDMKALYEQAGQRLKNGDDSLAKKLFGLRQSAIKYITLPEAQKKPMLQRILEEKLGKQLQKVDATVGQVYLKGDIIPNLSISLETTTYSDGSPIAPDLSAAILKSLENVFGYLFKAQWVQSTRR